ncbi:Detected protein of unknown function [Hibiscus syriacus]|uniref:Cytochrome P450 n=1 Tax=Hibiscus syriacus TaxID=106335 RepID=A0A6A2WXC8_HIBSY|nr:Detected protein of unknown function [Hibiscus syriacus]
MAASKLFKNHDHDFCDRKYPVDLTTHDYCLGSLAFGRYGESWRMLHRICSKELLVNRPTNETTRLRRKCTDDMIRYIEEDAAAAHGRGEEGKVNLAHFFFLMSFNLVGNLVLSRDLLSSQSKEGKEFFDAMKEVMVCAGKSNLSDFLPVLKWLDPQGIKRNMVREMGRAMKIVSSFVEERIDELKLPKDKTNKDLLDALLEHTGEGTISNQNVIIIIMEMFFASSETTSSTIKWAMAELLRNPESMTKAKEELDLVIRVDRRVEDSDMDNLPYLQAEIKETLRLHPALPLLIPRNSMLRDQLFGVFDTQGDTDFELIPFGSGRRICVGISLAHKVVHLAWLACYITLTWSLGTTCAPKLSI